MDIDEQQMINMYTHANAISGQVCQFSRALLNSDNLHTAKNLAKQLLESTGASGFLRLNTKDESQRCFINKGVSKRFLSELQTAFDPSSKIIYTDSILQIQMANLFLVLNISSLTDHQKDALVDYLAIFSDTLSIWLENFDITQQMSKEHVSKNMYCADQIQNSIEQLHTITSKLHGSYKNLQQELLCSLTKSFPTMALEHDQEELILNLIDEQCEKHKLAITEQSKENESLVSLLFETKKQLQTKLSTVGGSDTTQTQAIELF